MRADGIEPTSSAWKAEVLPLNYARRLLHFLCKAAINTHSLVQVKPPFPLFAVKPCPLSDSRDELITEIGPIAFNARIHR